MIFGYLAYLALVLSITAAIAISLADSGFIYKTLGVYTWYVRALFVGAFSLMVCHLFVASSLGIYYLMDRLYRRDRQIVTQKPERSVA
jgi:hypothetical protein